MSSDDDTETKVDHDDIHPDKIGLVVLQRILISLPTPDWFRTTLKFLVSLQGIHFIKKVGEMKWSEILGPLFPNPEMKWSEMIDKTTSLNDGEMKFSDPMFHGDRTRTRDE